MTEPAVSKSPRTRETVTAVASRTATVSFLCRRADSPSLMYFQDLTTAMTAVTGAGRKILEKPLRQTAMMSFSSNSRFSAREVCSGTRSMLSALAKENRARAETTAARSFP